MLRGILCLLVMLGCSDSVFGDDLVDLIPAAALAEVGPAQTAVTADRNSRSIDLIASAMNRRDSEAQLLPPPTESSADWSLLTRLNFQGQQDRQRWSWHWNNRLQFSHQDDATFQVEDATQLYLKEAYLSYAAESLFIDGGRINLRYGVASGFNPTDYYRSGTAITSNTIDSGRQREDRLGSVALRLTQLQQNIATTLAISPDAHAENHSLLADENIVGLNLDQTNAQSRLTLSSSWQPGGGLLIEMLLHFAEDAPAGGINLSYGVGQSWLLHLESSLSRRKSLLAESALADDQDEDEHWQIQTATGATWTSSADIAVTCELHYNQAGMSDDDWQRWFDQSDAAADDPALAGQLWSVRELARDLQEPLSRWQLYLRTSWNDAIIPDLTLNGVVMLNPIDHSHLSQFESIYPLSDNIVLTARLILNTGSQRSEHGSTPTRMTSLCQLEYYF